MIPNESNQPKVNFLKHTFGRQQRGFSASWYQHHPWVHYLQEEDSLLCFYCATAIQRKLPMTGYYDKTFTEACYKFIKHEQLYVTGTLLT